MFESSFTVDHLWCHFAQLVGSHPHRSLIVVLYMCFFRAYLCTYAKLHQCDRESAKENSAPGFSKRCVFFWRSNFRLALSVNGSLGSCASLSSRICQEMPANIVTASPGYVSFYFKLASSTWSLFHLFYPKKNIFNPAKTQNQKSESNMPRIQVHLKNAMKKKWRKKTVFFPCAIDSASPSSASESSESTSHTDPASTFGRMMCCPSRLVYHLINLCIFICSYMIHVFIIIKQSQYSITVNIEYLASKSLVNSPNWTIHQDFDTTRLQKHLPCGLFERPEKISWPLQQISFVNLSNLSSQFLGNHVEWYFLT